MSGVEDLAMFKFTSVAMEKSSVYVDPQCCWRWAEGGESPG